VTELAVQDNMLKNEYNIRLARPEDIPGVMLVNLKSLPENYWYGFYSALLREWPDLFFVVEHRGEIVGYAMSRVEYTSDPVLAGEYNELENGPLSPLRKLKDYVVRSYKTVHLISIAVLEPHRGKGLGSKLLENTILAAKRHNADSVFLEVRVSNEPAIRLYEKFGFKKVRIIREYYRDGEDAYVMVLKLDNKNNNIII